MQEIQTAFFHQLSKRLKNNIRLSDEIAAVLNISKSEAYKKLSGQTFLSIAQIQQLCDHFKTTFTIQGAGNRSNSNVNFTAFHNTSMGVNEYITGLRDFLQSVSVSANSRLTCATDDIPIFHLFQYPELTAFKLHFWQMRIVEKAPFRFKMNDWPVSVLKSASRLHYLYLSIPSVEIWAKRILQTTHEQIILAAESKMITDKKLGREICRQLRAALSDIELYAINRSKSIEKEVLFDWYFYDVIGTITYLAEADGEMAAYIRFNTFNTIKEENGLICQEVKHWLRHLQRDAIGFSGQGSVQRNKYLSAAYDKCDEMSEMF